MPRRERIARLFGGAALMAALGFERADAGACLVLRSRGGGGGDNKGGEKKGAGGDNAQFAFPQLDSETAPLRSHVTVTSSW